MKGHRHHTMTFMRRGLIRARVLVALEKGEGVDLDLSE